MPDQLPALPDFMPDRQQESSSREVVIMDNGKATRIPGTGSPDSPRQVKHEVVYSDGSSVKVEVKAPSEIDPATGQPMDPKAAPGQQQQGQGQPQQQQGQPQQPPPELAAMGSPEFMGDQPPGLR